MKKLLWIGDACCDSGFAKATHNTLETLRHSFDISVLGINHRGDSIEARKYPYDIYPTGPGGDLFGIGRLPEIVPKIRPDVIVIQNDPWNIPHYMKVLSYAKKIPVVGILAVDGFNCRGGDVNGKTILEKGLNSLSLAVFWTEFGRKEAHEGGYRGPSAVIPLGVNTDIYYPRMTTKEARERSGFGLPDGAFVIGNVNRNQPRKRMDLTLEYFAQWMHDYKRDDAYLFVHAAPTGEQAYDITQLLGYFARRYPGVEKHVFLSEPEVFKGLSEELLVQLYCAFDIGISTTQGEGWGLPALEMMACGVPQLLPDWSAYSEWAAGSALLVPCTSIACTFNGINVVGGIADKNEFINGLESLYSSSSLRESLRDRGLQTAQLPSYRWENIGTQLAKAINETLWPSIQVKPSESHIHA